jgi:transitional endoplasmic reticulum ATPase
VDLDYYAETSYGFVGADIALHCKEAAMHALRGIMSTMKENEEVPPELIELIDDYQPRLSRIEKRYRTLCNARAVHRDP